MLGTPPACLLNYILFTFISYNLLMELKSNNCIKIHENQSDNLKLLIENECGGYLPYSKKYNLDTKDLLHCLRLGVLHIKFLIRFLNDGFLFIKGRYLMMPFPVLCRVAKYRINAMYTDSKYLYLTDLDSVKYIAFCNKGVYDEKVYEQLHSDGFIKDDITYLYRDSELATGALANLLSIRMPELSCDDPLEIIEKHRALLNEIETYGNKIKDKGLLREPERPIDKFKAKLSQRSLFRRIAKEKELAVLIKTLEDKVQAGLEVKVETMGHLLKYRMQRDYGSISDFARYYKININYIHRFLIGDRHHHDVMASCLEGDIIAPNEIPLIYKYIYPGVPKNKQYEHQSSTS